MGWPQIRVTIWPFLGRLFLTKVDTFMIRSVKFNKSECKNKHLKIRHLLVLTFVDTTKSRDNQVVGMSY